MLIAAYFGDDAKSKQSVLDLVWPVQLGVITNWDDADRILRYAFNDRLKESRLRNIQFC